MPSGLISHAAGDLLGDRYRLADDIRVRPASQIWRGVDERLRRPVSIRLLAIDSPAAPSVRAAAIRAAGVDHRTLLPVLDIVVDDGVLAIISDWTDLPTLAYLAREPLDPRLSVDIALEVGKGLLALADAGLSHGRLQPNVVHLDGAGELKLRGYQIDAAMHSRDPDQQAWRAADAAELVGLLYLCLTGSWPDDLGDGATPTSIGRIPPPSRLVADVPHELDEWVCRGLAAAAAGSATIRSLLAELTVVRESLVSRAARRRRQQYARSRTARVGMAAAAITALLGITTVGITQASQDGFAGRDIVLDTDDGLVTSVTPAAEPPLNDDEQILPIVGMSTIDPDGDGIEYAHLLSNIIDADPGTAWTTKSYFTADVGGKRGVGVIFDLGYAQEISAVDLQLVGTSTDFTIAVGPYPQGALESFLPMADVKGAGQTVFVRIPRVAESRALLVWITKMPLSSDSSWDTGYRAGIRSATIYGHSEDAARAQ
jgi:hypothetical protein